MDVKQIERLEALLAKVPDGRWEVEEGGLNEWGRREYHLRMTDGPLEITEAATFYGDPHDINLACAAVNALPALLQLARAELNRQKARANEPEWCPRCFRDVLNFWRDDDGIPRCSACGAKVVALVPVPVKEGA